MKPDKKPARKPAAKAKKTEAAASAKKSVPTKKAPTASPAKTPTAAKSTQPAEEKAAPAEKPAAAKTAAHRKKLEVPPILLEGDAPGTGSTPAAMSGPGSRFALGQQPATAKPSLQPAELPESYGTQRVFLAARDPHWLYCSWDLTRDQQRQCNRQSRDGHLLIRVFMDDDGAKLPEVHVHPESRSWFVYVPKGETRYHAELGYYEAKGGWRSVSASKHTITPPDAPSTDITAEFATIPAKVSFRELVSAVEDFIFENRPLVEAIAEATAADPEMAPARVAQGEAWTPEQVSKIAQLVSIDRFRRVWMGSMEITEMIRRHLQEENASIAAAELARGREAAGLITLAESSVSSPFGGEAPTAQRGFWFNINAELIVYGATEPNATVQIGDRPIKLRPDGTFSFRFALPDGNYALPVAATSADKEETKEARLRFTRSTEYHGGVNAHPQDSNLRKPSPKNVR